MATISVLCPHLLLLPLAAIIVFQWFDIGHTVSTAFRVYQFRHLSAGYGTRLCGKPFARKADADLCHRGGSEETSLMLAGAKYSMHRPRARKDISHIAAEEGVNT